MLDLAFVEALVDGLGQRRCGETSHLLEQASIDALELLRLQEILAGAERTRVVDIHIFQSAVHNRFPELRSRF